MNQFSVYQRLSAAVQGKVLLLITNSDYLYTDTMMTYAYDPYLPSGRTWRDLFDMVIVQVRFMRCLCWAVCT